MKEVKKNRSQEVKHLRVIARSVSDAAIHITEGQMSRGQDDMTPYNEMNLASQRLNVLASFRKVAKSSKKVAFTLAEVLITLGIIGIVAAMTMPALITKHQKQVTVTSLKKIYTTMSQAKQLSETQNGAMEYWDFPPTFDKSDIEQFFDKYFRPYMQVIGECESEKSCSSIYTAERPIYILKDGTQIMFSPNAQSDTLNSAKKFIHTCIDTNGNKGPNRYGKDMFIINIHPQKGAVLFGQASDSNPIPKGREELKIGISINSGTGTSCCSHSCPVQYAKYYNCGALIQADGWQIKDDYPW